MQKNIILNNKNHPKAYVKTFGCQMNVNDSEYIVGQLKNMNYVMTDTMHEADLILLNSCCVRKKVEQKIYSLVGKIKKLKIKNPDIKLGLCGCLAQKELKNIFKKAPSVDFLLGPSQINDLEVIIKKIEGKKIGRAHV